MTSADNRHLAYLTLHGAEEWQGAGTHVREIVHGLRRRGWRVSLFAPQYREGQRRGMVRRAVAFVATQWRLLRRLRNVDAVYVRHHPAAVPVALATNLFGIPRVEELNGTLDDWWQVHAVPWPVRSMIAVASRYCLRTADCVAAVNEGLGEWARTFAGVPEFEVVPNGVDAERFGPHTVLSRAQSPYAVYVGALVPWEGIQTLLTAAASPQWPSGLELVIAGDGPLRAPVVEAARGEIVRYLGPIPHEQVPELIAGATLAISPYEKKPWGASPIKLYEAMASGVPVIGSDCPGQREVLTAEKCGLLYSAGDANHLVAKILELIDDPRAAKSMGERGRRAAVARHSWRDRAERIAGVLDGSVNVGGAPDL